MKQIKNATLAVLGGLLILSVATVSCSKKSSGPAPTVTPTIGTINPTATDSIGTVITITGTGFTSASTVTIGGVPATVTFNSATSISVTVPHGVTVGTAAVIVTTGTEASSPSNITVIASSTTYVTPDGKNTSDSVSHSTLLAYWPFKTNSTESISNIPASTSTGASFVSDGPFTRALQLTNGYLIFPAITNLNSHTSVQNYTVSMWIKDSSRNDATYPITGGRYSSLFQLTSTQLGDLWGVVALTLHTNEAHGGDTMTFGTNIRMIEASNTTYAGVTGTDHTDDSTRAYAPTGNNTWINVVQTFNGFDPTRPLTTYVNGVAVNTKLTGTALTYRQFGYGGANDLIPAGQNLECQPGGGDIKVCFGTFAFSDDFGATAIWGGAYYPSAPANDTNLGDKVYWAHGINAEMSSVRVFSTALSQQDVTDLYLLGSHGQ